MNTLLWHLLYWARRLGAAGLAGLGLLALALLLQLGEVGSLQRSIAARHDTLAQLRQRATQPQPAPVRPAPSPLDSLPPAGTASQQIGELERLARSHGLRLLRGQYSVMAQPGTSLQRWQLTLPVEAPYPTVHAFLAAALERLPNLTLDQLKLKRDRIENAALQAELRMSLFVESAP